MGPKVAPAGRLSHCLKIGVLGQKATERERLSEEKGPLRYRSVVEAISAVQAHATTRWNVSCQGRCPTSGDARSPRVTCSPEQPRIQPPGLFAFRSIPTFLDAIAATPSTALRGCLECACFTVCALNLGPVARERSGDASEPICAPVNVPKLWDSRTHLDGAPGR